MRHELTRDRAGFDVVDLAVRLGGLHSQVDRSGWLIAAVRSTGAVRTDALWGTRELVRSWTCRGTLHLIPAAEYDLWAGALSARETRQRRPPSWYRTHGCTAEQLAAITTAVGESVDADPITREELIRRVVTHLDDPELAEPLASGWGVLLKPAAAHGLLISGPPASGRSTFVRPSSWLGRPVRPLADEAATKTLVKRFIDLNGVVRIEDIAAWWGDSPAWARQWVRHHRDELTDVTVSGLPGFLALADSVEAVGVDRPALTEPVLLPMFDPFVLAPFSHRAAILPEQHNARVFRKAGWVSGTVVSGDAITGTWSIAGNGGVEIVPFGDIGAAQRSRLQDIVVAAFESIGDSVGSVSVQH
ncbi:DNA glycosylase AlkZ-like family protein [Nocardia nova]|nr:crosslink repair DNA glycosylase YcaQ family protein [Nocardia nova]